MYFLSGVVAFFGSIVLNVAVLTPLSHRYDRTTAAWRHFNNFAYDIRQVALMWTALAIFIGIPWWVIAALVQRRRAKTVAVTPSAAASPGGTLAS